MRTRLRNLFLAFAAIALVVLFLPLAAAQAVGPPAETGGAAFNVDAANNRVSGGGWTSYGVISIQVWDGTFTTMLASETAQADDSGYFEHPFGNPPGGFDLTNGQAFVVFDGVNSKVLTAEYTALRHTGFDYVDDITYGDGAVYGVPVQVCFAQGWANHGPNGCTFDLMPNPDGTWSWDLVDASSTQLDLLPQISALQASQYDGNGDGFGTEGPNAPWPHLNAVVGQDFASAHGFDLGSQLHLVVTWPDATTVEKDTTVAGPDPTWFHGLGRPLEVGTTLTLTGPAPAMLLGEGTTITRTLTLQDMAITDIDLSTQWVSGYAWPGVDLMLYPHEPDGQGDWVRRHVVTDPASGAFAQTFTVPGGDGDGGEDATLTMTPAGDVVAQAFYYPNFDSQGVQRPNAPLPPVTLSADPTTGLYGGNGVHVWGTGFTNGVSFVQCHSWTENGQLHWYCDNLSGPGTRPDGSFDGWVQVRRTLGDGFDCGSAPEACGLTAFDPTDPFGRNANVRLTFAAPPTVTLTINPNGTVNTVSGWVTVTGTISCSVDPAGKAWAWAAVTGEVWQRVGRTKVATGTFTVVPDCTRGTWTATVKPGGIPLVPFGAGRAQVTATAELHVFSDVAYGPAEATVQLKAPPKPRK